ncbi:hypothetical protein Y032_0352g3270 [Ancylostoma ceylanicum]|uniref:Uncharacterized protein n=1 Tax=Ancylostoma ceylanicum TaxID=53326 RepID=A0A016RWM4_9BILA|nr:hypothetical protein Y032_0352g3270 [Ancylostoma ceylanicum]
MYSPVYIKRRDDFKPASSIPYFLAMFFAVSSRSQLSKLSQLERISNTLIDYRLLCELNVPYRCSASWWPSPFK